MATLLHLDSSLNGDTSVSREVTRSFREAWEEQHPEGTVVYRDLAADPLPHLTAGAFYASLTPAAERTPEQRSDFALRDALTRELEEADAVLIGAPMYNFAIPSTLKAWLDHVIVLGRTAYTEQSALLGKPVTLIASRGGSYAPGTPQEGNDFAEPHLRYVFGTVLGMDLHFIVPELTLARTTPAMADLIDAADASRAKAHDDARAKAKTLAARLAA
ncbi:FMN-dependent NADH-azoreductase [Streptomyces sp. NBC_01803]|uniref:FMN-dependent NADH-azoreductase n=1 Tax=Streptomyces sp. NBC_01803 TaxID=2975946 RepID=UPI002DDABFAA|nr:NAD(P)H-dependent oxidoreductase [Streptomyces sp. NBC_01803]WSA45246.1 NAD(P)H-dependent oxidoreductase [Streptomyces sp. NBC_01803]